MRKRIVTPTPATVQARGEGWLDLENAATVEVTSEDKDFPIESSLSIEARQGWRAAEPGVQTIRLVFDQPQELRREVTRTQEFVLRASSSPGGPFREIVRQQWNFSAPDFRMSPSLSWRLCPISAGVQRAPRSRACTYL